MSRKKLWPYFRNALVGSQTYELHPEALHSRVYPLDLEFTLQAEDAYYEPKDVAGIPMHRYSHAGVQYNPSRVAAYALAHFNRQATVSSEESRTTFLRMADWLMAAEDARWRYEFAWKGLDPPWISCLAQGTGISVLVRAYEMTQDDRYLAQAQRAAEVFGLPLSAGGVRSKIPDAGDFLEEYPKAEPDHVLNGFLYAIIGILDLAEIDDQAAERAGLAELLATLTGHWCLWDLSYWTAYDLHVTEKGRRNPATVVYHKIHMSLVGYLGLKLNNAELQNCVAQWMSYYRSFTCRTRAFWSKVAFRLEEPAYA